MGGETSAPQADEIAGYFFGDFFFAAQIIACVSSKGIVSRSGFGGVYLLLSRFILIFMR